jgi:hypothetical protein
MSSIYYSAVWTHQACKILARKRLPRGRRKTYLTYKHGLYPQVKSLLAFFPDKNKGWSQKALFQRAREVKADVTYQELYWIFCAHKHTLPMAASGLTITRPSGRPDVTIGPHIKGVYHAAFQPSDLFLKLCNVFQHTLGRALLPKIQKCSDVFREAPDPLQQSTPIFATRSSRPRGLR